MEAFGMSWQRKGIREYTHHERYILTIYLYLGLIKKLEPNAHPEGKYGWWCWLAYIYIYRGAVFCYVFEQFRDLV